MLKPLEIRGFSMSNSIRQRVHALGLTLPAPSQPIANYINHVISQNQLFISGQIPTARRQACLPRQTGGIPQRAKMHQGGRDWLH